MREDLTSYIKARRAGWRDELAATRRGHDGVVRLQGGRKRSYLRAAVKALGDAACWGWGKTALGQMTSRAVSCWIRCLERRVTRMVRGFSVSVRISPRPSFSVCRLLSAR